jgi:hypothetical protein
MRSVFNQEHRARCKDACVRREDVARRAEKERARTSVNAKAMGNPVQTLSIARNIVGGIIQNSRQIVLRGAQEHDDPSVTDALRSTADGLRNAVTSRPQC